MTDGGHEGSRLTDSLGRRSYRRLLFVTPVARGEELSGPIRFVTAQALERGGLGARVGMGDDCSSDDRGPRLNTGGAHRSSRPSGCLDDEDGAGRPVGNGIGHTAEHPPHPLHALVPHNDEIRLYF